MNRSDQLRRAREITTQHGAEIRARYEAGASTLELAMEYGLTNGTVWRTVRANGGTMRGRNPGVRKGKQIVAERGAEMAADYARGDTMQEVAGRYGVTLSTVAKVVRAHGGDVRKRGFGSRPIKGRANPAWKGGGYIKDGYRMTWVPADDPLRVMAHGASAHVPEHRLVMARLIKRPLDPTETVHHIDGDRLNNHPDNLQLRRGRHGNGQHFRCQDCGSQNVRAEPL